MTLDRFQKKFNLTMRERQVAGLLASGCARKQISSSLGIAIETVHFHLSNLRRKINAASMQAATAKISASLGERGIIL